MRVAPPTAPEESAAQPDPDADWIRADPSLSWIRRLGPLLRQQRARIVTAVIAAILATGAGAIAPWIAGLAVDAAVPRPDGTRSGSLWTLIIVLVGLGLARGISTYTYRYGLFSMGHRVEFQLRTLLFAHLSRLSFAFYDRVHTGEIISRSNSDIRSVQMYLAFAPIVSSQLLNFVVAIAVMAWISLPLTAITMLIMPAVYVLGQRLRHIMFPLSWIIQSRNAEVATVTHESVNGVRVVKAFAAEARQVTEMAQAAQRLRWANMLQHNTRAHYTPVIENLPRLAMAMVLLVGGHFIIGGSLSVGNLATFYLYILLLQAPFRFIGMLFIFGQRAKASAERVFQVLDEPVLVADRPGAVDLPRRSGPTGGPAGMAVEFEDVRFAYGTETIGGVAGTASTEHDAPLVFDGLDLRIGAGERVAIVGRTGCGKSTLARLLMRFYSLGSGTISVDGHEVNGLTGDSLRRAVGLVPDEPFLFSATIHDNIAYARPDAARSDVVAAATAAQAHEFISELEEGYDTVVGERGYDLSGGQRQRIAIARAILADPAVLILDDATSSIDVAHEAKIHDALVALLAERTTIVIAHRLSTISLADRVILLDGGRVAADGTHAELLATEPRYVEVLAAAGDTNRLDPSAVAGDGTHRSGASW
ncbi:MAG: ABC transporter ATP-binding protein [Acidimicrobiales bacterium]|nr:ABC transporter ATP-binding protein [Acidimicrobiales bacterium]MYD83468.1 ABC transporter ATP-binding protein [Acidimicrobiales bacterium]MYJ65999.1 ABC transporter ATP-binding protein [Acidimicrobiales bacterium]